MTAAANGEEVKKATEYELNANILIMLANCIIGDTNAIKIINNLHILEDQELIKSKNKNCSSGMEIVKHATMGYIIDKNTMQQHLLENYKKIFPAIGADEGGHKRKGKKSRKSRKSHKSRKVKKSRKSRKGRKRH